MGHFGTGQQLSIAGLHRSELESLRGIALCYYMTDAQQVTFSNTG